MSWNYARAQARIAGFLGTAPQMTVERFDPGLGLRLQALREARGQIAGEGRPLYNLPEGVAIVADTVQVYVNLINYDEMRLEEGRETPRSHARALSFLHLHYGALDRVVEDVGAQRVDFHGARMHAVIAEPVGEANLPIRIARGLRLALEMMSLSNAANRDLADNGYAARFRVGIDFGPCVAIDSGRRDEREPMFVGSPANHAAHLAEGSEPGIYPSLAIRRIFGQQIPSSGRDRAANEAELIQILRADTGSERLLNEALQADHVSQKIASWRADIREHRSATIGSDGFDFHIHALPIRTIDYARLMPSNSIRMPLVSLYADIDNYTAYVDDAVASGTVGTAVRNLHVLRSEMNAVVQEDFEGRKVRFIGDCIHALVAAGEGRAVADTQSVDQAVLCAGALRSSFKLCQEMLQGIDGLGLAIGFELGETPVSRIGIRGDRSVRVASSKATIGSQASQELCEGDETRIGDVAFSVASRATRALFPGQVAYDLDFDDIALGTSANVALAEPAGADRSHLRH